MYKCKVKVARLKKDYLNPVVSNNIKESFLDFGVTCPVHRARPKQTSLGPASFRNL